MATRRRVVADTFNAFQCLQLTTKTELNKTPSLNNNLRSMKVTFTDSDRWPCFSVTPESMKEISALFRLVKNAKKQKPELHLSFSDYNDPPVLTIQFQKVNSNKQINSIST